ncbi:MAG: hypothetical protein WC499_04375, partial [Patescibacteria group bacterium]
MTHRAEGFDDIFENSVIIRKSCQAKDFIGDGSKLNNLPLSAYALKAGNVGTLDGIWSSTETGPAKMGIDWNYARLYDIDGSGNEVNLEQGFITMANGKITAGELGIDNININGAIISSNTGEISFSNENLV